MIKNIRTWAETIALVSLLAFVVSCTKNEELVTSPVEGESTATYITIAQPNASAQQNDKSSSRVAFTQDLNNFNVNWEEGDIIGVYEMASDLSLNPTKLAEFKYETIDEEGNAIFKLVGEPLMLTNKKLHFRYPADNVPTWYNSGKLDYAAFPGSHPEVKLSTQLGNTTSHIKDNFVIHTSPNAEVPGDYSVWSAEQDLENSENWDNRKYMNLPEGYVMDVAMLSSIFTIDATLPSGVSENSFSATLTVSENGVADADERDNYKAFLELEEYTGGDIHFVVPQIPGNATVEVNLMNATTGELYGATFQAPEAGLAPSAAASKQLALELKPLVSPEKSMPAELKDGVTVDFTTGDVSFVIYAPGKTSSTLIGGFNNYIPSSEYIMNKDGEYFWITLDDLAQKSEYSYQYLIDGKIRVGDPYCEKILDPWNDKWINYNSMVYPDLMPYPEGRTEGVVSVFSYEEQMPYSWVGFSKPPRRSLAIYELLIRDFTTEGTINAVTAKLDYLENLGINAIELMPIQEFDGNDSWGYNPMFYFAMDKAYGTKEDYKNFINECHKRGIAVIVDVVFNHATDNFPWLAMWKKEPYGASAENPFFNEVAKHPFNVFNDFNHENAKVKSYFKEVLQFMVQEYNIDGFRFDLSKGLTQKDSGADDTDTNVAKWTEYDQSRVDIINGYAQAIRDVSNDAYIILEHIGDFWEELHLSSNHDIMLWDKPRVGFYESVMGWGENSNLGSWTSNYHVGNIEDHDEERISYKARAFGNGVNEVGYSVDTALDLYTVAYSNLGNMTGRLAGLYALHFLSPGTKMLWQFGELGYDFSIDFNGRTGKKPIRWDYLDNSDRKKLYDEISKIISWRTDNTYMYSSEISRDQGGNNPVKMWWVGSGDMSTKTLVYSYAEKSVIVVTNFTDTESEKTDIPLLGSGEWKNLITNETYTYPSSSVIVPANSYIVLVQE